PATITPYQGIQGLTATAAECKKLYASEAADPGRHHVGTPGDIISECLGDFVGIRNMDGQDAPEGDLLGYVLRDLEKGIREGRIKPVIIGGGPVQIPMPGGQPGPMPSGPDAPQVPGGDIFGQILRDVLGGALGGTIGGQMPQGRPQGSPANKDLS